MYVKKDLSHWCSKFYRRAVRRITTISATNHIGHSLYHIGHKQSPYRPQTTSTSENRPTRSTNALWNENGSKQQPATFKANWWTNRRKQRRLQFALNLEWLRHVPNVWGASARWRNGVAVYTCVPRPTQLSILLRMERTGLYWPG